MSTKKTGAIVDILRTRANAGKLTVATLNGKELSSEKLRRHMKYSLRHFRADFTACKSSLYVLYAPYLDPQAYNSVSPLKVPELESTIRSLGTTKA